MAGEIKDFARLMGVREGYECRWRFGWRAGPPGLRREQSATRNPNFPTEF